MRSDADATRVLDCFTLDSPICPRLQVNPMMAVEARRPLGGSTNSGTPLVAAVNPAARLRLGGDWRKKRGWQRERPRTRSAAWAPRGGWLAGV
jgi:hypothetical protein